MQLVIDPHGVIRTLYDETLNLGALGVATITRASQVEPDADGRWWAQIIGGPTLGPFARRSDALAAEIDWLGLHRFLTESSLAQTANCQCWASR